jgi:cysteine synthase
MRITQITATVGVEFKFILKLEFMNTAGSVKDRSGPRMKVGAAKCFRMIKRLSEIIYLEKERNKWSWLYCH